MEITWQLMWLNGSVATLNAMLQLLDIYIYIYIDFWHLLTTSIKILLLEKLE